MADSKVTAECKGEKEHITMREFLGDDFLLNSVVAIKLYNDFAKDLPIIDYHCHLNPQQIYEDKQFENATDIWLKEDHYKWRVMRANGIDAVSYTHLRAHET